MSDSAGRHNFSLLVVHMKIHAQLAIKNLFTGMVGILYFQTDTLNNDHGKRKERRRKNWLCFLSLNLYTSPPTYNILNSFPE